MTNRKNINQTPTKYWKVLSLLAVLATSSITAFNTSANETVKTKEIIHKAYVYTELQISIPFKDVPWHRVNKAIKKQPGFINKTWLSGVGNQSAGGIYTFDSIENAQKFVTGYFPKEARGFGVAMTARIFDASETEHASRAMNSPHYGGHLKRAPAAFVYTEVQANAKPFNTVVPWQKRNPQIRKNTGFLAKTWLSGLHTGIVGGLYAFDSIENAKKFAIEIFPTIAADLNKAFYTRVFDASVTEKASREMNSPYYK